MATEIAYKIFLVTITPMMYITFPVVKRGPILKEMVSLGRYIYKSNKLLEIQLKSPFEW